MDIKIALAGNPNCGKTTLFNALTGSSQYVGNWPGVTVEKKEGRLKGHKDVVIQDLPGIYSLSPYTLEEVVARSYLVNEKPDAILNIVDGTNIERNLYLTTQLIELGLPVVVAVNMMPGKQGQMDWGFFEDHLVYEDGKWKKLYCFLMILGYSRMRYIEFVTDMSTNTLIRCHQNAFRYFGGYPEEILYDNMSPQGGCDGSKRQSR